VERFLELLASYRNGAVDFLVFALFHTVTAQRFFTRFLEKALSVYFVRYVWRIVYVWASLYLYFVLFMRHFSLEHGSDFRAYFAVLPARSDAIRDLAWLANLIFTWALVQIDTFSYLGIRQLLRGIGVFTGLVEHFAVEPVPKLRTGGIYGLVRHPIYLAMYLYIFLAGISTASLMLIAFSTAYLVFGIYFEECKLIALYGEEYRAYRRRVPCIIPRLPTLARLGLTQGGTPA
jgi:protein-S-isoprenylcysteine O-methyltransferase Ste14